MESSGVIPKTEIKVVAIVLAVLGLCEAALRLKERSLSVDISHIRSLPATAEKLRASAGQRLLFIGNSLTRYGIDAEAVRTGLAEAGSPGANVFYMYPDGGGIAEWLYGWEGNFQASGIRPDRVVLCFGHGHLVDGAFDPSAAARLWVPPSAIPEALSRDMPTLDDKAEFCLASLSAAYAHRIRVQRRLLDVALPHYREVMTDINDQRNSLLRLRASGRPMAPVQFTRLERLLSSWQEAGIPGTLVAMPMYRAWDIPSGVTECAARHGIALIDMRHVPGLRPENYFDKYHLDPEGGKILGSALAAELAR